MVQFVFMAFYVLSYPNHNIFPLPITVIYICSSVSFQRCISTRKQSGKISLRAVRRYRMIIHSLYRFAPWRRPYPVPWSLEWDGDAIRTKGELRVWIARRTTLGRILILAEHCRFICQLEPSEVALLRYCGVTVVFFCRCVSCRCCVVCFVTCSVTVLSFLYSPPRKSRVYCIVTVRHIP